MKRKKVNHIKDIKFTRKMSRKLFVLMLFFIIALIYLMFRLFQINRDKGESYKIQVLSQQASYNSKTIPYQRGDIVDRKGTVLATSEKVYNIIIDAKVMNTTKNDQKPYVEPTIKALKACFDVEEQQIRDHLSKYPTSQYYILKKKLSYDSIQSFLELQKDTKNNPNIKGVWFEDDYIRKYPYNTLACDLIGFTLTENQGYFGIEEEYNSILNGTNGREYGYLNDDSKFQRTIKDAVNGNTVMSTIDVNIQSIVEKYILEFNESHRNEFREGPGSISTSVIVANPNNGEILAMADYPCYDLNDPKNPPDLDVDTEIQKMREEKQKALEKARAEAEKAGNQTEAGAEQEQPPETTENSNQNQTETGNTEEENNGEQNNSSSGYTESVSEKEYEEAKQRALNQRWRNFSISNTYEPGSTYKPFTIAAGLEVGKLKGNEHYFCDGYQQVADHMIKCTAYRKGGHGDQSLSDALSNSCNDALMQIGASVGISNFIKYQRNFNIGRKTNIDLPGEVNAASLVYTENTMGPTDLATNSFGQSFNVTMIQTIAAFSSVINGGNYYQPHVVKKITSANGGTVENFDKILLKQTVSAETSDLVRGYLNEVVATGTGKKARVPGYSMGGKTGTAEMAGRNKKDYVVSFIGYAPADNPQVLIYVVIDRPNVAIQASSSYAMEISKNIMTEVLPYLNIFPTEEYTKEELKEIEEKKAAEDALKAEQEEAETEEEEEEDGSETKQETEKKEDPYYNEETGDNSDPDYSFDGGPIGSDEDEEGDPGAAE